MKKECAMENRQVVEMRRYKRKRFGQGTNYEIEKCSGGSGLPA
jgi:hypothetical protein